MFVVAYLSFLLILMDFLKCCSEIYKELLSHVDLVLNLVMEWLTVFSSLKTVTVRASVHSKAMNIG